MLLFEFVSVLYPILLISIYTDLFKPILEAIMEHMCIYI